MSNSSLLEHIKLNYKISDVLSRNIQLKLSGYGKFKAICPFHKERTPSFYIDDEKKMYKCFCCGESGDVINFVQKYNNLEFREALDFVASALNIDTSLYRDNQNSNTPKNPFIQINQLAINFFTRSLDNRARKYLLQRNISDEKISYFNIGYAPRFDDNNIYNYLLGHGWVQSDILESGLIVLGDYKKCYSFFRDRIIIPIYDQNGNPVGFGGRSIDEQNKPKYLNSKESEVFKKNDILYNFHNAKKLVRNSDFCLIVEGYMDVIALYDLQIPTVAITGTAFSEAQLLLLKKYWKNIVLWLDSDNAGIASTIRIISLILKHENGVTARVVKINGIKDADSYFSTHGHSETMKVILNATQSHEFLWEYFSSDVDFKNPQEVINLQLKIEAFCQEIHQKIRREYLSYFKNMIYKSKFRWSKKIYAPSVQSRASSKLEAIEATILYLLSLHRELLSTDVNITFLNETLNALLEKVITDSASHEDVVDALNNISSEKINVMTADIKKQLSRLVIIHRIEVLNIEMQNLSGDNIAIKMQTMVQEKQKLLSILANEGNSLDLIQ